jgi:hypothetical protein
MSKRMNLSRREYLKGAAGIVGGALGTRLMGKEFIGTASAQAAKKSAVVTLFFEGGFNALFASADSFVSRGSFSCSSQTEKPVANGLVVDKTSIGTLGDWALGHMAAIGNRHGINIHQPAQVANFIASDTRSYIVQLAAAMGGTAAYKAVAIGSMPSTANHPSENGVSIQLLRTMADVSTALGLGPIDYNRPARDGAARGIDRARAMSQAAISKNPTSMRPVSDAYGTLVDSLGKPPLSLDVDAVAKSYGASSGSNFDALPAKLAAAELMIRAGTNVISISDTGWDSHGDSRGTTVRTKMEQSIIPSLQTFVARLQSEPALAAMNITLMLHGDFARNLPTSDHASVLTSLVIGSNVKVGTTGRVSEDVGLPANTGASREMWSYIAELARVKQNPFGTNPHPLVL